MGNGAIQTEYAGHLFRSRLEARWAVFFDALSIPWKYETEGFEDGSYRYLPDFYLPGSNDWVEVKGDPDGMNSVRMRAILTNRSPLPGFARGESCLLVLGDVPKSTEGTVLHQALHVDAGVLSSYWFFFGPKTDGWKPWLVEPSVVLSLFGSEFRGGVDVLDGENGAWSVRHETLATKARFAPVFDAYRSARHARFEHGAHGA